ncbi:motility associated factor glycosyltransferase family protein [Lachnospiraceae bacterium MD1]|uniref:Motility associated factor glycosyltransferase family protein n=1 Tax=Variimorphobacter saccharofermentans TaxID=2755051 RepID=A0A839K2P8_9FIRM|nr:6-hydroxymethylpterin diphosphokinase MptE-like protein [Variimorphobacter saccharofermentans]MBB2184193.1 motility associated factor glycosyltransferase family protein [Variimorphobacter saccharofermentans]
MNYLENNMECIKKNRPYMYKRLIETETRDTSDQISEIKSVITKDNSKTLYIKKGTKYYRLNSIYSPSNEANIWADQFELKSLSSIISMFGFGNGEFARSLINRIRDKDILVIYEPSIEVFYHVIEEYDITDILSNMQVSFTVEKINDIEFHNTLRVVLDINNISTQIICTHPFYDKIFPESGVSFFKELKDSYYNAKININTEIAFGKRFIENTLHNIRYLRDSISIHELKSIVPTDIPAMIIAAGPSVSEQIEYIRQAKGKVVIFAVDRILEFLLENGIEPDFVVTLDPMKPVQFFSNRTDVTIPLLCFIEANHEILDRHIGKKIFCNCTDFLKQVYENINKKPPMVLSSSSVATLSCLVCVELGFTDIILVGQDLAYDGNKSHSGREEISPNTNRDIELEDIEGKPIRSRYDWKSFKIWYEDLIALKPHINIIDAKTKGAKINGSTIMPLKDVLVKYCNQEFDYNTIANININTFDQEGIYAVKHYLDKNYNNIEKIIKKAKGSIKYCNILIDEINHKKFNSGIELQYVTKIRKNNQFIQKSSLYKLIDIYVKAVSMQDILEMNKLSEDYSENKLITYMKTKKINEAIIEAADFIKPKLEDAIKQVVPM